MTEVDFVHEYTFEYSFAIESPQKRVTFVSAPSGTNTEATSTGYKIEKPISGKIPKNEVRIYYKTEDMFEPVL